MPKLGVKTLTGKSGRQYEFNVYPASMRFNDFIPGVYYISRQAPDQEELPIYIGESDNVDIALQNHEQQTCFDEHEYNRVAFHKNASRDVRKAIITDLQFETSCNK
jgi:bifunctional DNase/RNase